jgi:hypothetical protein
MARGERLDLVANGMQALQLGGEEHGAGCLRGPADIETADTDGITSRNYPILLLVEQNPSEHTIKVFGSVETIFHVLKPRQFTYTSNLKSRHRFFLRTYQWDDDFAVRMCLVVVLHVQRFPHNAVVVDFTVDGQGEGSVIVNEGLRTGVLSRKSLSEESSNDARKRGTEGLVLTEIEVHTDTDNTQTLVAKNCKLGQLQA